MKKKQRCSLCGREFKLLEWGFCSDCFKEIRKGERKDDREAK